MIWLILGIGVLWVLSLISAYGFGGRNEAYRQLARLKDTTDD